MSEAIKRILGFPGALLGRLSEMTLQILMKKVIPISWHIAIRDSGLFQTIGDYGAFIIGIGLSLMKPSLPFELISTRRKMKFVTYADTYCQVNRCSNATKTPKAQKILRQSHVLEIINLCDEYQVAEVDNNVTEDSMVKPVRPVLMFVHGGAWGSGRTWHYTIIARNLGRSINASHVILVSYPYYPNSTILEQRDSVLASIYHIQNSLDMKESLEMDSSQYFGDEVGSKYRPLVLAGHSSGANIIALALYHHFHESASSVEQGDPKKEKFIDMFLGLSGVYDIEKHYQYESKRGVQHLSPMGAAAVSKELFWRCSPTLLIHRQLRDITASSSYIAHHHNFPYIAVVHGVNDDVVPYASTMEYEEAMLAFGIPVDSYYPKVCLYNTFIISFVKIFHLFSMIMASQSLT